MSTTTRAAPYDHSHADVSSAWISGIASRWQVARIEDADPVMTPCLRLFLLAAGLVALPGCGYLPAGGEGSQVPAACRMQGNGDGSPTCMTSLTSVLAAPDRFDGMKISVGVWVDEVNDAVLVFPTREALDMRDSSSSLVIYRGTSPGMGAVSFKAAPDNAMYVRATGVFHWNQAGVRNAHADPVDSGRMGVLESVTIER
ncbi:MULTISPECIES: hypothetical protein [unclassified Stenotrophomonas]|uniref:hypothetical protein n=1 Tax=unclassified Stenotrophomonas TaxID=196198 RepID=UPI00140F834C|nr:MULTISPECIES: hypothetical protein [unclassified Stenotrophomonas]MBD3827741.1 hypothetical protein [Stenotrophomonas sp.]